MRILVTGGSGYIGSILVPELLAQNHQVTVVDNFMFEQNSLAQVCADPNFSVVNGDIRDERLMTHLLKKAEVVIPLAGIVGAPLCAKDPVMATSVNREAQISMFKKLSKEQWVLMPTTNSAYGTGEGDKPCDENSPLKPISLYAVDKVEVEKVLMDRPNSLSFRLATVFGMSPKMRIDLLVNDFTYRAVYDRFLVLFESGFKRNYINVRDVTRAFRYGLENFEKMRGEIFNIGLSSANLTKKELCAAIKTQIPSFHYFEAEVGEDPDKRNYIVSNDKIEKTGYRTEVTLEMGIQELIKGYTMIKNTKYTNV